MLKELNWIKKHWFQLTLLVGIGLFFLIMNNLPPRPLEQTAYWPSGHISYEKKQLEDGSISETYWYEIGQKKQEAIVSQDGKSAVLSRWYKSGQIEVRGQIKDDQYDGTWTLWNSSGILDSRTEYFAGEKHGLEIHYHDLGNVLSETNYKYGKKHGEHKLYDYQGNLLSVELYDRGKLVSAKP